MWPQYLTPGCGGYSRTYRFLILWVKTPLADFERIVSALLKFNLEVDSNYDQRPGSWSNPKLSKFVHGLINL